MCKSYICSLNLYVFLNVIAVEAYVASWIEILVITAYERAGVVEAYVASWIEIMEEYGASALCSRRGLCSLVD